MTFWRSLERRPQQHRNTSFSPSPKASERPATLVKPIAIALVVASVIHLLILLRGFYSATMDESGRTLEAYNWMQGSGSLVTVWLPFYKLVVGGSLFIIPDLFVTPRIVSYLFGLASLCSLVWLSHVLFRNRTTTLVAGLIGALLPQRVVLSVAPLSEIMFITAITLAIAFLGQWFSAGRRKDILLSATLFAVASSVRYEGWVFAVLFAALAIFKWLRPMEGRKLSFADARDPIFIAISFMALWVTLYFIQHGRPFGFVAETAARYTLVSGDTFERSLLHNPLAQYAIQNVWTLNILGLLSLRLFMRQNVHSRTLVVLPALALLVVSAIAFWGKGMPSHGVW